MFLGLPLREFFYLPLLYDAVIYDCLDTHVPNFSSG
jgi:hypothetical protein